MKILVLAGGLSPERDVSMTSGSLIANALLAQGYQAALVDVFIGVEPGTDLATFFESAPADGYHFKVPEREPDLDALRRAYPDRGLIGPGIAELCRAADVVFVALHGAMGENGQLQAFLDVHGICYTGSPYEGCALAMNKAVTKALLREAGVPVPDGIVYDTNSGTLPEVPFPCFVKPCCGGSSIGTSRADNAEDLARAIEAAKVYESRLVIEGMVPGREFSVGILEDRALPPIEIRPLAGFYDYARKYQSGLTEEICPADLTEEQTATVQALALRVFHALGLRDYARVDFIMREDGSFVCLEANTLPGMTPTSLLPQEAAAVGIDYHTLCRRIIELARKH